MEEDTCMSYEEEDTHLSPTPCVSSVWRRIHACHMRRRIHACHMRRRIHACPTVSVVYGGGYMHVT
jgi:hypothetical protein